MRLRDDNAYSLVSRSSVLINHGKKLRTPTLVNTAIKQEEMAAKREKKGLLSVLFPQAKQQTYSIDVGNEDSFFHLTSWWLRKSVYLRALNGSTTSTIAHLWRTGGGFSVILLTVNLSCWDGINDLFHQSHPHPVHCLVFSTFCVHLSQESVLYISILTFLHLIAFHPYPMVSLLPFPSQSFLLIPSLPLSFLLLLEKRLLLLRAHQAEWLPLLLILTLIIAAYTPTPWLFPTKASHILFPVWFPGGLAL